MKSRGIRTMKKNRIAAASVLFAAFLLSSCGNNPQPEWLNDFYNGNYEYRRSTVTIRDGAEDISTVFEGKVISSPYKEYVRVIEPEQSSWREAYYYGSGKMVKALYKSGDQYTSQPCAHPYPYGYNQDLIFKEDRTEDYNGVSCTVYTTEYTDDLSNIFRPDAETATISQEYYVDNKTNKLVCVITDLTDLNEKSQAAMHGFRTDSSIESESQAREVITEERLEILFYDDEMNITIPDV